MDIGKLLGDISLLHWIIGILIVIIVAFVGFFWFVKRYIRLQLRFAKNLKRKVYFLKTSDMKNLQTERDALKDIKIFNIEDDIKSINNDLNILQKMQEHSAFVIGYDPNFDKYGELLKHVCDRKIPVIIFARPNEIQNPEHWKAFNSYICCDIANTTNRILVILLNTLMIA